MVIQKVGLGKTLGTAGILLLLTLAAFQISPRGPGTNMTAMGPAVDLRRFEFPTSGATVAEHSSSKILVATDGWMLTLNVIDGEGSENVKSAFQGIAARQPDSRLDTLRQPGGPSVFRLMRGLHGPNRAIQVEYVVSFERGWAYGGVFSRDVGEPLDVTQAEEIIVSMKLLDRPRLESEVSPAWLTYQRDRKPGSPIAKYVLSMWPAPVTVGASIDLRDWEPFTDEDFRRGGRQLGRDRFEFYSKGDPSSIRLDVWMGDVPLVVGREPVFDAALRLDAGRVQFECSGSQYDLAVPTGEYDVSVTLVHRGREDDRLLTDAERFARDDLERYEVALKPRGHP